jgi:ATPase subunit of ABC transporter with duplicated ATPase domains
MLIIKNLNIYHQGKNNNIILKNINLSLDSSSKKRVALIGPNGSGKTTFLKQLVTKNKSIITSHEKIAYLDQHIDLSNHKLISDILKEQVDLNTESYKIDIFLEELNLSENILNKTYSELSGGQILKIRLLELLLQEPTILVLDEPTNHLDQASKKFLSNFIKNFHGSVLLVSHDRNFLEETINQVWAIQPHTKSIQTFTGRYSEWRAQNSKQISKNNQSYTKLETEVKSLQKWLKANSNHPKYRFSSIVMSKKQKLSKLEEQLNSKSLLKTKKITLNSDNQNNFKQNLLLSYNFNNHPILRNLKGKVYNNDKILLEGPNGSGKTTFLNSVKAPDDNIIYNKDLNIASIDQISNYNQHITLQALLHKHTQLDQTKVYQKLAQMNLKPYLKSKLHKLSGGERKRLQIAILLSQKADLYLLDEPTNHLDIQTQEIFQEFLQQLSKPFILVSHDKFLKDDIVFTSKITLSHNA